MEIEALKDLVIQSLDDMKAKDIVVMDVRDKTSITDIMVVAIFMAYIGFNGIVGNQLDQLREGAGTADIVTANGTQLMSGFYLFLTYCLLGLFLAERISGTLRNGLTGGSGNSARH